MALGEILRNARVQKGLTPSDVAESTHMLVQVVESLEQEDFRRIAAPIYGRGFVKLYAELLELDPEPLISDFMSLYEGARAPAVRTKKVEQPPEPASSSVPTPVTRTVSGPAPRSPQRQPVQPRPAVRALAVAQPEESPSPSGLPLREARLEAGDEPLQKRAEPVMAPPDEAPTVTEAAEPRDGLVVEPEEPYAEADDMDLFRAKPPQSRPEASQPKAAESGRPEAQVRMRKAKHPVFQIGGRMEKGGEQPPADEAAHARRHARMQTFMDGIAKLKDGVERKLPEALPQKQMWLLGGAGLLLLALMATGISVLFKMTGTNVKETPGAIIERVAPPPALYVD